MATYTDVANVKQESGFTNNTNIVSATVTRHITASESHIDSIISKLYTLPLSSVPGVIEKVARYLSAGSLMLEEYGTEAEGTSKDGQAKIDWANDMLTQISDGTVRLVGSDGVELPTNSSSGVYMDGLPDSNTGTDMTPQDSKDDPPQVEIGMKF